MKLLPNGLARAAVRFKPASFAGTFVALLMAALIVSACGILLETGLRASVPPKRYANAPVVAAADQNKYVVTGSGEDREKEATPLPDTARMDAGLAAKAAGAPGAATAVADFTFPVRATDAGARALNVPGGVLTAHGWGSHTFTGTSLTTGSAPREGEVVLDAGTARAAHAAVGDTVVLETAAGRQDFRVAGVAEAGPVETARDSGDAGALTWFADTQAPMLAGHPGKADAVVVLAEDGTDADALAGAVKQALAGSGVQVHTGDDRGAVEDPGLGYAKVTLFGIGGSFGGIAAIVAVFTAAGTVALSVGQRAREFALLRAVGATPRQVRRAVASEALLVAPLAGIIGCLPGIGLAHWWFGQLQDRGAIPRAVDLHVSGLPLLAAVVMGLLTALGAGWMAGRRPAKIKPGQALSDASVERLRPGLVRTLLGVGALVGGTILTGVSARSAGDDAAGAALGVVMLFMLAVGLLGPLVARLCAGLFGLPLRGAGPSAELAAANSRTNARRLASAITPIVLAVAFSSTLVFMHTSENHAADKQLRAGITADHVVTDPAGLPVDAAARAARAPGVEAAVGLLNTQVLVPTGSGEFKSLQGAATQGVTGSGAELAKVQDLDVRDGSLDRLGEGRIAIGKTLATSADAGVGDRLPLYLPDGTEVSPEIVAVYGRGLGLATVTMDRASLAGHVTSGFDSTLLVRGGSEKSLTALGEVTDASGYATEQNRDAKLGAWMNNTMAAVLGGFAAVAAVNTLVMTVLDRRRELGMLRLVGSTRRQVMTMLRWEGLLVAVVGLVLGSAIAAATLIPMMSGVTGDMPYVPPLVYGCFAVAAGGLALLAVTLPARAALRRWS
ncbi:ABC transporter integral membrane subunit [Streptomyces viridosporus ATCC 14672]|uniref:ABC transporter integral membrane subunit n=1 Tax=Streptomyces viridosporus (strain ATCC 14672 / DSM 40746 / JCM 4963 / KCTC 9882 / NRRL B-12104 / FH 1290) TaxID=566461 RepID=D6A8N8_STRV1|nr:FtsX-like permease family protein [Streptomyces viridosporus]EFE72021.1 ABC transporter integral membrane subunit [Streptomyces viridosporus ATCC 14672]